MRTFLFAATAALAACTSPTNEAVDAGPGSGVDAGSGSGSDGFAPLIHTDWTVPAGSEKYLCVRVTATTDTYIQAIRPDTAPGTHHEVLMLTSHPTVADGVTECDSSLTEPAIYASGVGSESYTFPDGVGLHVAPGQQLFLNLHLFNTSDAAITGTSGVSYLPATPSSILHEAGAVLAGKTAGLVVPPGTSTQVGTCTTPGGLTLIGVGPHMHLLGSHMTVTYTPPGGATQTVLDTDYSFDNQQFHPIAPITTVAGGKYVVSCSYVNPTGATVKFGESTTDEMCFAMTLLYPPMSATTCTQ